MVLWELLLRQLAPALAGSEPPEPPAEGDDPELIALLRPDPRALFRFDHERLRCSLPSGAPPPRPVSLFFLASV